MSIIKINCSNDLQKVPIFQVFWKFQQIDPDKMSFTYALRTANTLADKHAPITQNFIQCNHNCTNEMESKAETNMIHKTAS